MTSISKTPFGEMQQFIQTLHAGSFTYEDVARINREPVLASKMRSIIDKPVSLEQINHAERQLCVWEKLGVTITSEQWEAILEQAEHFVPITDSDVPLVTGGFGYANPSVVAKKLFEAFTPPSGYIKRNYISDAELRFVRGMKPTGNIRLVHYDSNTYAGISPEAAANAAKKDKVRLAGLEVLEYLLLTPEFGLKWGGEKFFYPNLSGLERKYEGAWSHVPFVSRWDDSYREFKFSSFSADYAYALWSSPVVREC